MENSVELDLFESNLSDFYIVSSGNPVRVICGNPNTYFRNTCNMQTNSIKVFFSVWMAHTFKCLINFYHAMGRFTRRQIGDIFLISPLK